MCPSREHVVHEGDIGGLPTRMLHLVPVLPDGEDCRTSDMEEDVPDQQEGTISGNEGNNEQYVNPNVSYPDRPLWRGKHCDLLNEDLTLFGKAQIVVCLLDEPFDEDNLGDTHVGVLLLSDGDMQMTSFRWPHTQVRLEGGRLLSEIATSCSEHAGSTGEDFGLEGISKNPYRHIKRRKFTRTGESKVKRKTLNADVQKVSSTRCCKYRCCQTFSWDDTLALRHKFYASSFECRR